MTPDQTLDLIGATAVFGAFCVMLLSFAFHTR